MTESTEHFSVAPSWAHQPAPRQERALIACEDCGEPATRETADGVWLCEGDFDELLERAFWNEETL